MWFTKAIRCGTWESPLLEAQRYQKLLNEPHVNSQADIARELGITRARVCQIMGLLKLAPEIQQYLIQLDDHNALQYFTERRLRYLVQIQEHNKQLEEFQQIKKNYLAKGNELVSPL